MDFGAFVTAFGLIFLAELPDKTAYTVLLLSARMKPLPVLLGAWSAFLAQGCVAFVAGTLLSKLPPRMVALAAGAVFLGFGLALLLRDVEEEDEAEPPHARGAFLSAFVLVFLAEMGDATQVGTAALVASSGSRVSVVLGATAALWTVSALGVTVGSFLGPRLPRRLLQRIAGVMFCIFGTVSVLRAFWPG